MQQPRWSGWRRWVGDLAAVLVVLLGGGLLGGGALGMLLGPAFFGGPDAGGPFGPFLGGPNGARLEEGPGGAPPEIPASVHLLGLAFILLPALLMLLRRRWPIPTFIAALAILSVAVVLEVPTLGAGIAVVIAGYALAFRMPRRPAFAVTIAASAVIVLLSLAAGGWTEFDLRVLQIAAGLLIAAALGDSSRSRHEYLAAATERAERAERTREAEASRRVSEERLRIARDLHDTVAHEIAVINLNAGVASSALRDRPEQAEQALGTIRSAARGVLGEIGDLLRYLRSDEEASVAAPPPQPGAERIDELVRRMRAAGLDIEVPEAAPLSELPQLPVAISGVVYRVVQEGLTNAHKHGSGGTARLQIAVHDDEVRVTVSNPVREAGERRATGAGLGLVGLRERVGALGGSVEVSTVGAGPGASAGAGADGRYFLLVARLPLTLSQASVAPAGSAVADGPADSTDSSRLSESQEAS